MKNNFESVINLLNKIINDKIKIQDEIILNETINVINTIIKNSIIYDFINSKIKIN